MSQATIATTIMPKLKKLTYVLSKTSEIKKGTIILLQETGNLIIQILGYCS